MNVRVIILLGSAALNAALLAAFAFRPSLAPPVVRQLLPGSSGTGKPAVPESGAANPAGKTGPAAAKKSDGDTARLWASLDTDNLPTLVSRLRAAGFSRSVILAIVNAKLDGQFADRMKALTGDLENQPFWKPDPMNSPGNSKYWEEYSQIYRERSRLLRELLGSDSMAWAGVDPATAQRRQFGNVPAEKVDLIQRINDDYAEMTSQIRAAMQGITLPEDREKLALLEREKRADLAAILTPAELEEYEMRSSPATSRLRNALTLMDASEDEFRAIFKVQQAYNERINPTGVNFFSSQMMDDRREAQRQLNEQLKAVLTPARYGDYLRASNTEYQQLYRIAQRENVPAEMTLRAFGLRDEIAAESGRIADNASLTPEQKRAALQALAQKSRTQIVGTLGATAGEAYAQAARWIGYLERGSPVSFGPDGAPTIRQIPPSAPPPKK